MITHLFKIVWNRKRTNFLVGLEIAVAFLVLFTVAGLAVFYVTNYAQPLGFSYKDVWNISIDMKQESDDYWSPAQVETVRQLYLALRDFPEVEAAAGAQSVPYSSGGIYGMFIHAGREIGYERNEVTDDLPSVLGIEMVRGRWFDRTDDGAVVRPVVINQKLGEELFGAENPVGRDYEYPEFGGQGTHRIRIIGVVRAFRKEGEFSAPGNLLFERKKLDDPKNRPPRNLLIKVRPGTTAAFEETLSKRLQEVARDWSFEVMPLVQSREASLRLRLLPVLAVSVIAAFLLIMVGLGLTGVLWQNVTQRTREIGLRRALGATAGGIYTQILGELLVVTTLALLGATALVVQLPLLDSTGLLTPQVLASSIGVAALIIYLLTLICGLYPSWLATRVRPAEALHYE